MYNHIKLELHDKSHMITMTCHRQLHDQVLTNVGLFLNLIHSIINPILTP